MYERQPVRRGYAAVAIALALVLLLPWSASVRAEAPSEAWVAPVAAGAPFQPAHSRSSGVTDRASTLRRIEALEQAAAALGGRVDSYEDSLASIRSELVALHRRLDSEQPAYENPDLAAFGIDVGAFPVDELRKMFYDEWNEPRSGGRRHQGTDLLAQFGVPLRAIEDGSVERIGTGSLGGNSVYLVGESGSRYYYAHLDTFADIDEGDRILAGEVIGTVGDSGNAKGSPHLHLQWAPEGGSDWQNPYPLLAALYGDMQPLAPDAFGPPDARG